MYLDIFVGVDGTGPYSDKDYETAFANSFVRQLSNLPRFRVKEYIRGPGTDGLSTGSLAKKAAYAAEFCYKVAPDSLKPRIFLSGYSRGGAAALEAAHILRGKQINVHGLLLFDAVDRSATISNTVVPDNVGISRHAVRNSSTESRNWFGNCGTSYAVGMDATMAKFYTTHGGMGGTPWGDKQTIDGKINEGNSSLRTALKVATYAIPAMTLVGKIVDYGFQTNVNPSDESAGSQAVWKWMSAELTAMFQKPPKV